MRAAVIASLLCAAGCRQLLGLDSPSSGSDARRADSALPLIDGPGSDAFVFRDGPAASGFIGGASGNGTGTSSGGLTGLATNDVIVIGVAWLGSASATLSDTDNDTFVMLDHQTNGAGTLAIYYTIEGGPIHPTETLTAVTSPSQAMAIVAAAYRGIPPEDPIDSYIGTTGTGELVQTPLLVTSNAHDTLVAIGACDKLLAAAAPFTLRVQSPLQTMLVEDRDVTMTGSYQASASENGADAWSIELVALRAGP